MFGGIILEEMSELNSENICAKKAEFYEKIS